MTAREDDYFTDVEMLYCKNCQYADVSKFPNGLVMLSCSNDGSDHCGHFLTEEHLACDVELYLEKVKTTQGKCKRCKEFESLNEDGLCNDCL